MMRPTLTDRLFVIWIAAALAMWAAALTVVWGAALDYWGPSMLVSLAAMMGAVSASTRIPGRAARGVQRVLARIRLRQTLAVDLAAAQAVPAARNEVRAMVRLLASAAILAAVGGLCSTAAAYLAGWLADALTRWFLWGPAAWTAMKLLIQLVGMVPMAVGLSVTFLATVMIRGGSGRDVYASVFREWLVGIAAGVLIVAVAVAAGAHVLGLAMVAAVALLAAGGGLLQRLRLTVRPRRAMRPIESPAQRNRRVWIAGTYAAIAAVLVVQVRLLRDVGAATEGVRMWWVGLSLMALAAMLRTADRKSHAPGRAQGLAATIGCLAGAILQFSLAVRCLRGGAVAVVCGGLAIAAQAPLAALASVVVSRQRRLFATSGGTPRQYLSSVSAGVGAGLLACLTAPAGGIGGIAALAVAMGAMVLAVVGAIGIPARPGRQVQWAAFGAVLICATAAAPIAALRGLTPMTAGVWLTAVDAGDRNAATSGCLPGPTRWRSPDVTAVQDQFVAAHPGGWWVVAGCSADLPRAWPAGASPAWSHPDPTAGPGGESFLHAAWTGAGHFDAALLAAMPADHPDAWRCYNYPTLLRCRAKVSPTGLVLLRTQALPGGLREALAVARTFAQAVGSGWAVVAMNQGHLDLLLAGPEAPAGEEPLASGARRPAPREGLFVVPLERLWPAGAGVEPVRPAGGGGLLVRPIDPEAFRGHVARVQQEEGPP